MSDKYNILSENNLFLPLRKQKTHKGDYGKVLIIGGSVGYSGAPKMSAMAALRVGAGLVYLNVPDNIYLSVSTSMAEAMVRPFESDSNGMFSTKSIPLILNNLTQYDAILIGPGLGRGDGCIRLVEEVIKSYTGSLVIDADGLYAVSEIGIECLTGKNNVVITPHIGEFLRLTGKSSINDHVTDAADISNTYGITTVLKDHVTAVTFPDGSKYLSQKGNPGMATGGSGDVLAGMILGFIGQFPLKKAVLNGVYLHGCAGDHAAKEYTEYSMLPTDMISFIPALIKKYTPMREGISNE